MGHKRIILVGPAGSGKNFIREAFAKRGYTIDVSYTSRSAREGEVNGIDYAFIDASAFIEMVRNDEFYEYVQFGPSFYGTSKYSWEHADVFIMENEGIKKIKKKDRNDCVIIYVNTPYKVRLERMKARGWDNGKIWKRILADKAAFENFTDYDIEISSEKHVMLWNQAL